MVVLFVVDASLDVGGVFSIGPLKDTTAAALSIMFAATYGFQQNIRTVGYFAIFDVCCTSHAHRPKTTAAAFIMPCALTAAPCRFQKKKNLQLLLVLCGVLVYAMSDQVYFLKLHETQ